VNLRNPPLTDQAQDIDRVWNVFLIGALVVGAFVAGLLVYIVIRFRRRRRALPRQVRENIPIELAYTVVPLVIVIGLFAITFVSVRAVDEVDDDYELLVEVTGFQWQWQFTYPDAGVTVIGTEAAEPELVLPVATNVRFDLRSRDVIHSFWIPGFRFKRDIFPERVNSFQVDVGDRTGVADVKGVCAEFCGLDHEKMRFTVRIVTADEFERWTQEQST
jgi:cytochrome c oxidase subunit 2